MRIRCDLHIHSAYSSDSRMSLDRILTAAKKRGLSAIAIADHSSCRIFDELADRADENGVINGVLVVPAAEIATDKGHILGTFLRRPIDFKKLIKVTEKLFQFESVIEEIRAADGMPVLAHPFCGTAFVDIAERTIRENDLAVECFNSRAEIGCAGSNRQAGRAAFAAGRIFFAGSDAHTAPEIGGAWIELDVPFLGLTSLKAALKRKDGTVFGRACPRFGKGLSQLYKQLSKKRLGRALLRAAVTAGFFALDIFSPRDRGTLIIERGALLVGNSENS